MRDPAETVMRPDAGLDLVTRDHNDVCAANLSQDRFGTQAVQQIRGGRAVGAMIGSRNFAATPPLKASGDLGQEIFAVATGTGHHRVAEPEEIDP